MRSCPARWLVFAILNVVCARAAYGEYPQPPAPSLQTVTVDGYRAHLQSLRSIAQECLEKRGYPACDPLRAGSDDRVRTPEGPRTLHYDWLRSAMRDYALSTSTEASKPAGAPNPQQRLTAAMQRLESAQDPEANLPVQTEGVRKNLAEILARKEFDHLKPQQETFWSRWKARLLTWLIGRLSSVASIGSGNRWLAYVLIWGLISMPCVLLAWWFVAQSRRPGLRYAPIQPMEAAPSTKEWQRWLREAEAFAHNGQWREGVHHVYWAAISRLESQGMWPADRARTPREYLRLLHGQHALLPDLRQLTRSFERIWYGHRPARQQEYRDACILMERLSAQ